MRITRRKSTVALIILAIAIFLALTFGTTSAQTTYSAQDIVNAVNDFIAQGYSDAQIAAIAESYNVSAADIASAYGTVSGADAQAVADIQTRAEAAFEQVGTVTVNETNYYFATDQATPNVYTAPVGDAGGTTPIGTFDIANQTFTPTGSVQTTTLTGLAATNNTSVTVSMTVNGQQVISQIQPDTVWADVVANTIADINCINTSPDPTTCGAYSGSTLTTVIVPAVPVTATRQACTVGTPTTKPCSEYAGSYGIPTGATGNVTYTLNSCGALVSFDIGGCVVPSRPTGAWVTVSPETVGINDLTFHASWGATGATSYKYRLDSGTEIDVGSLPSWTGSPASLGLGAGQHSVSITACNVSGCTGAVTANFEVMAVPPAPSVTVSPSSAGLNQTLTASWSLQGTVPVTLYKYKFGTASSPTEVSTTLTAYTLSPSKTPTELNLASGPSSLKVEACNLYGCGPEGTGAFSVASLSIPLWWEGVSGATSYRLEMDNKTTSSGWSDCTTPLPGDSCSTETAPPKTFAGAPGSSYTIKVYACNAQGCSAGSASVDVTCNQTQCYFSSSPIRWGANNACGAIYKDDGALQSRTTEITLNSDTANSTATYSGSTNLSCVNGAIAPVTPTTCSAPVVCPASPTSNICNTGDTIGNIQRDTTTGEWTWSCARTGATTVTCRRPNTVPGTPTISGDTEGNPNTMIPFTFTSTDPDNDNVHFGIDWSGNRSGVDEWAPSTVYVLSGGTGRAEHSWSAVGTYQFNVLAEDTFSGQSGWRDHTITIRQIQAPSTANTFTITSSAGSGGTISPLGARTVARNGSLSFTMTPNSGFRVSSVVVDGVSAGIPSSYTFPNVTADHTISVTFEPTNLGQCVPSSIIEARYDDNAPGSGGQLYSWNYNDPSNLATSQLYDGNTSAGGINAANKMVAVKLGQPLASARDFTLYGNWGSQFSVGYAEGTGETSFSYFTATGGTVSYDGDYKIHKFSAVGDDAFVVTSGNGNVEVLVVGGGGGSGSGGSGGGGGGGVAHNPNYAVTTQSYSVRVGAGGAGSQTNPIIGGTSVFGNVVALGGGPASDSEYRGSRTGGSGGGGSNGGQAAGSAIQGDSGGATGYGFAGGANSAGDNGGGGGGAGAAGATTAEGGKGGDGRQYSISGTPTYYGGGGGGGITSATANIGGQGGGGQGGNSTTSNTDGTPNTGGGGGGGATSGPNQAPKNGGSGVVIVRYRFQDTVSPTASAFAISPAVSGKTTWSLITDGPLTLNTAGTWTITPLSSFSVSAKMWGAGGGAGQNGASGGGGGYSTGVVSLTAGTTYQLVVGQGGLYQETSSPTGYGFGGRGSTFGGQGGGGTAIVFDASNVPILVAGGGGGGGSETGNAGAGGGANAQSGSSTSGGGAQGIVPGTGVQQESPATAWGTSSAGGNGGWGTYTSGGGGGGYAGGGAMDTNNPGGGGGGSGYVNTTYVLSEGNTLVGSGATPGNSADTARGTSGAGSTATATRGGAGLIKISRPQ